jgi:Domain of unknown function (DUF4159)
MIESNTRRLLGIAAVLLASLSLQAQPPDHGDSQADVDNEPKETAVYSANLVYGSNKTSVCFSDQFLTQAREDTLIDTHPEFDRVDLASDELFDYPFAVMTGEGKFELTEEQALNLQDYLYGGGFLVASAGCSSEPWNASFKRAIRDAFPDLTLTRLDGEHPIYHSVYDISKSRYKKGPPRLPRLDALQIDGRVVLVWSPDGLNDTASAGPDCCCCGGNEVRSAKKLNVNLLAYALTH